ncbi:MAG TPA: thioredoxin family protein [Pyrinomonadaceae bacterium]|nr:thioredoxin family protein [Pyrinomonadaceae bacterium]
MICINKSYKANSIRLERSNERNGGIYNDISCTLGSAAFGRVSLDDANYGALMNTVMKQYIDKAMTFAEYVKLIDDLLAEGKTTGPVQSEAMFGYGKINRQRMLRLEKTAELNADVLTRFQNVGQKMIWLVITEGWCGDAAQNIPVIEKMAAESNNIETLYLLRDENPELIDKFLTGGGRAIPKLIVLDAETLDVLGSWGARPEAAQQLYKELKLRGVEKLLIMENLQRWYNADRNQAIQSEFVKYIEQWEGKAAAEARA